MKRMNIKLRKAWTAALRSGQYKQGKMKLRRSSMVEGDTYCCLGVLCEVCIKETKLVKRHKNGYLLPDTNKRTANSCLLTEVFMDKIKLNKEKAVKLIAMNDSLNRSFARIADYIDRYV